MSEAIRPLLTKETFKHEINSIFKKHGLELILNNVAEIKGWIFRVRGTENPALQFCYIKWESSTKYHYARYDLGDHTKFLDGAKTVNLQLFNSLKNMKPLIIFADPHFIRAIRYSIATNQGIPFQQKYNQEDVIGIDINDIVELNKELEILIQSWPTSQ